MSARARPATGAVVVRSRDPERRLQGLRTALALALGDRPADLYLLGDGVAALDAPAGSDAAECLVGLREAGVVIVLETAGRGRRCSRSPPLPSSRRSEGR